MTTTNENGELGPDAQLPADQQEDESDLRAGQISFSDTVSMNVDWTVETVFGQVSKGNIELDPAFQRRAAWDRVRKSRLIESLIAGMPVPNIVLAESKTQRGRYIVIDGKQRILAITEFMRDEFHLDGLDIRSDLTGFRYSSLPAEDKSAFENSTFRSTVIKGWSDDQFLYAIFYRLNSGSLPLSPQELRRALVGGNLLEAIEDYIINSAAFRASVADKLDRRMRDSELVLRFIAFDLFLDGYDGNLKKFLDDTARHFENDWSAKKAAAVECFMRLDLALQTSTALFRNCSFKKWTDDHYERVINRAVFDAMTRFFADDQVAAASQSDPTAVENAYKLLSSNQEFRQAIERTTKTVAATHIRLDLWGAALADVLGMQYDRSTKRIQP